MDKPSNDFVVIRISSGSIEKKLQRIMIEILEKIAASNLDPVPPASDKMHRSTYSNNAI